jgi:two-component system, NtrC family, response regulator HydG
MQKILVIDDDVAFCNLLERFLTKNSFVVTTSFTAEEAKIKIKNESFDLILTDLRLPDADGILLLSEIKKTNSNIPILLMTGYSDVIIFRNLLTPKKFYWLFKMLC